MRTPFEVKQNSFQSRCKPCHIKHIQHNRLLANVNKPKEVKEPKPRKKVENGFQTLSEEKQDELLKYLDTMHLTKLAERVGVNRNTLARWRR